MGQSEKCKDAGRNGVREYENMGKKEIASRTETALKSQVRKVAKRLTDKFKQEGLGQAAGRSGGHGVPFRKAGAELIRQANRLPKSDPLRDALKNEGKRLINKGKSINEKI